MNGARVREFNLAFSVFLAGWGFLLFFESAYFASGFYGITPPWWTQWVGMIPIIDFNIIDTVFVAVLLIAVVFAFKTDPKRHLRTARGGGSIGGGIVLLIFLILLAVALYVIFGLTLPSIASDLKGFLGI